MDRNTRQVEPPGGPNPSAPVASGCGPSETRWARPSSLGGRGTQHQPSFLDQRFSVDLEGGSANGLVCGEPRCMGFTAKERIASDGQVDGSPFLVEQDGDRGYAWIE